MKRDLSKPLASTYGDPVKKKPAKKKTVAANTKKDTLRAIQMRDQADRRGNQFWTNPKAEKILADRDKITGTKTYKGVPYGDKQGNTKRSLAAEYTTARKKEAEAKHSGRGRGKKKPGPYQY